MPITPISPEDGENLYGITCEHSKMDNGELRFRLKKNDGTAYIRTEASEMGGWQNSHYHKEVKETYIVQSGWIGYVELEGDTILYHVYKVDETFTTRPEIVHNVYMPAHSVIHTVKHGNSKNEMRLENDRSRHLDEEVKGLSENDLLQRAQYAKSNQPLAVLSDYSDGYRHFDKLIWQVPAWSTGFFAVVLAGLGSFRADSIFLNFVSSRGYNVECLFPPIFLIFGIIILVLSYALYRFRWHQLGTKNYTQGNPLRSPQFWLQLIVLFQGFLFSIIGMVSSGMDIKIALATCLVLMVLITVLQEMELYRKAIGNPKSIRS